VSLPEALSSWPCGWPKGGASDQLGWRMLAWIDTCRQPPEWMKPTTQRSRHAGNLVRAVWRSVTSSLSW